MINTNITYDMKIFHLSCTMNLTDWAKILSVKFYFHYLRCRRRRRYCYCFLTPEFILLFAHSFGEHFATCFFFQISDFRPKMFSRSIIKASCYYRTLFLHMALILSMSFVIADCKWKHKPDCIASKAHIIGKLWHEWESIKHIIWMRPCYAIFNVPFTLYSSQYTTHVNMLYILCFVIIIHDNDTSHLSPLSTFNSQFRAYVLLFLPLFLLKSIE